MITISRDFEWDMGHRVTNHDSKCRNPHGHRYMMRVHIQGDLVKTKGVSDEGMVIDFGKLKGLILEEIVDDIDHSFVYWCQDDVMSKFAKENPDLKMREVQFVPTAENLVADYAHKIEALLIAKLPGLDLKKITLHETPKSAATWTKD